MHWEDDVNLDEYLNEMYEGTKKSHIIGFETSAKLIAMWLYIIAKLLNIIIERMDEINDKKRCDWTGERRYVK